MLAFEALYSAHSFSASRFACHAAPCDYRAGQAASQHPLNKATPTIWIAATTRGMTIFGTADAGMAGNGWASLPFWHEKNCAKGCANDLVKGAVLGYGCSQE
jgi:hypothetical protein